jgi:TPR repeat protein
VIEGSRDYQQLEELCGQAADTGDIDRMDSLRRQLLLGLHDRPRRGVSIERQEREEERWYRRAARAGSCRAMIGLARLFDRQGRLEESAQWFHAAADAGSTDAMISLAKLLQGGLNEAEQWLHCAIDAGSLDAMISLAELMERQGRLTEAEQWLGNALYAGSGHAERIMQRLADLCERDDRRAEAEQWLRTAIDEGSVSAMVPLAELLARQGRPDEAEQWLHRAINAGWRVHAMRSLAKLLAAQGRHGEADKWSQAARRAAAPGGLPTDWGTIVTTAMITSAVIPFVQTIVTKAAEDSYTAARALIRDLLRKHGKRERQPGRGSEPHVLVKDSRLDIALELRPDMSDDALRALAQLDLEELARRCADRGSVRISFNPATGAWEVL